MVNSPTPRHCRTSATRAGPGLTRLDSGSFARCNASVRNAASARCCGHRRWSGLRGIRANRSGWPDTGRPRSAASTSPRPDVRGHIARITAQFAEIEPESRLAEVEFERGKSAGKSVSPGHPLFPRQMQEMQDTHHLVEAKSSDNRQFNWLRQVVGRPELSTNSSPAYCTSVSWQRAFAWINRTTHCPARAMRPSPDAIRWVSWSGSPDAIRWVSWSG
jgi:hypothetical protein